MVTECFNQYTVINMYTVSLKLIDVIYIKIRLVHVLSQLIVYD